MTGNDSWIFKLRFLRNVMLYLISLGLADERDMSLRALEAAKGCDKLYLELYTDNISTSADKISKLAGRPVHELQRKDMEDDAGKLIQEAKTKDIGIFIGGDALSATTHLMLLSDAKKAGIDARVIHGSSIMTAVAETGLQLYKFGRTVTLTRPLQNSTLDYINKNIKAGLHTLVLLDIGMDAVDGMEILRNFLKGKNVVAACRLGCGDAVMRYGSIGELLKGEMRNEVKNGMKGKVPAVICIPGELHFSEEEFLQGLGQ